MSETDRKIHALLSDITYPMNIGGAIRTQHVLGGGDLYIHDPRGILAAQQEEVHRFSSSIFDLREFKVIDDLIVFLQQFPGRKIATGLSKESIPLPDFQFKPGDLILFGNERTGLQQEIVDICDSSVIIPMLGTPYTKVDYHPGEPITGVGEYPSLNVSIAHAILTYSALEQIGAFEGYQFTTVSPKP